MPQLEIQDAYNIYPFGFKRENTKRLKKTDAGSI
jgi:hypothetical protein